MLTNRTWVIVLAVAVLVTGGFIVLDRTVSDDDSSTPRTEVEVPGEDPTGAEEPQTTRVYVDNSGPTVSVSIRTSQRKWARSLDVTLGELSFALRRDGYTGPAGRCAPEVTDDPDSLLVRLSVDRACLVESANLVATVSVDGAPAVRATARRAERPNVLMLMVDDMRTDELQWMPNVQELLAAQGVTFENGFSGFPLCCPARASVLTGQLPHNHGVWSHVPPWGFTSLRDSSTFATWLQGEGYHTTYLGKYLNGYGSEPEPGKDTGTSTQYVPPGWDLWRGSIDGGLPESHPDAGSTYRYFDTTLNDNGNGYVALEGQYQTSAYAELTRRQIGANAARNEPWFGYVSFTAPHHGGPTESDDPEDMATPARPRRLRGTFDDLIKEAPGAGWKDPDRSDKPRSMRRRKPPSDEKRAEMREAAQQRGEALYAVDEAVKQIMDRLRTSGELQNTVVVFTSDNGYFLGEQNIPAGKILPYEPSLRVPLVMRGPGIPKGEVRTDPFLSIDYAPTFADLADAVPSSPVDGRSLLDVARLGDEAADGRWSRVVLTETDPTRAARRELEAVDPVGAHQRETMQGKTTGIRTSRYLYTEWLTEPSVKNPGVTVELYDVIEDPDQYENLAVDGKHDDLLAQFHDVLAEARTCSGPGCRDQRLPESLR